jgi:Pentapeptide repeats (8 copies)
LRGADLRQVDLQNLPLARMQGGLYRDARALVTADQYEMATIHLEGADLAGSHLEGARLFKAHLEGARLYLASLKEAYLREAHLERTDLFRAQLQGVILRGAYLGGANLRRAYLERAELERAVLTDEQHLSPRFADVHWGTIDLTGVKWSQVEILGDEHKAQQRKSTDGSAKKKSKQFEEYEAAVRAYHQLTSVLQNQGLNDEAARFAYRAQVLKKWILWHQIFRRGMTFRSQLQAFGAWFFSWFLFLLAGYGYKPSRSFLAYLLVISGFAMAYYLLDHTVGPALSPLGALVFSMTSFHGRGFFPGNNISLDDPLTVLAALEALVGLIIEVTFIATLTQRFFNR